MPHGSTFASTNSYALPPSAHETGVKLQRMIKGTRQYLFFFVPNRNIPATNNGSELGLRPCAMFCKITNGFRTERGAKLYADIRSVALSSKPPAAAPSAQSKQSVSPSPERPSRCQHSRGNVSNYNKEL
jgi:Transposase IS66 family